ncbi:MAG TPA: hypothetical protein VM844_01365 [Miltoncostaeaceae bacterium]|nr:hypothetical protein [Miltoncostaeaceae bacterium]
MHLADLAGVVVQVHEPAVALVGDPGLGVAGLLDRLGPAPPEAVARRAREVAAAAEARRLARARVARAASGERVSAAAFARAVAAAVGPRDLVVDEALTSARALRFVISRRARPRPGWPTAAAPWGGACRPPSAPSWPTAAGA